MNDEHEETGGKNASSLQDPGAQFSPTIQDQHLAPGNAIVAAEERKKRRPTVTVMNSSPTGIIMQVHTLPNEEEQKLLPEDVTLGYQQTLNPGANQGVDKGYFDFWKNQNKHLTLITQGMITAQDEKKEEEQDEASAESESSDDDDKKE